MFYIDGLVYLKWQFSSPELDATIPYQEYMLISI